MSINKIVVSTLKNPELSALLGDPNIYFQINPSSNKTFPYITFFVFDEMGEAWADNTETSTGFYVQVDIWSKDDYTVIAEKVKELMINAGFKRRSAADLYEQDVQVYHKGMRFSYFKKLNG